MKASEESGVAPKVSPSQQGFPEGVPFQELGSSCGSFSYKRTGERSAITRDKKEGKRRDK
jgi:hypothetical protein